MPVIKSGRKGQERTLVCDECSTKSKSYVPTSPAAPDLTACEQAGKDGWGYTVGFFSMLSGHNVLCPKCAKEPGGHSEEAPERWDVG